MTAERLRALDLPPMVHIPQDSLRTAFTVSVDARNGNTTGISAADRARTIRVLVDPASTPSDLVRPGHVFPLQAKPGGVLRRPGHAEAAVDLCRLAGLEPVGVICGIPRDDGMVMRELELKQFASTHGLPVLRITDLIRYRLRRECLYERGAQSRLPTPYGEFLACTYRDPLIDITHLALVMGRVDDNRPVLVCVHSECLTGDVFGALGCACDDELRRALALIAAEGRGVFLYMRQAQGGMSLANKIRAYALQDEGCYGAVTANEVPGFAPDTYAYGAGAAQILDDLGIREIRLLTDDRRESYALEGAGLAVVERVPLQFMERADSVLDLATQRGMLGHWLG